jgi:polyphosphate kinase
MCSIVPGIKKLSDSIKIHSNIGRFLEHHRIFYFHNNGDNELFLSSSDFLERNLDRRIEVTFPIEDKFLANVVYEEGLKMMINDADRWVKVKEGKYKKISKKNKRPAQELIIQG